MQKLFLAFFSVVEKNLATPRIGNKPRLFIPPRPTYPCTPVHVFSIGRCQQRSILGGGKEFGLQCRGGMPAWMFIAAVDSRGSGNREGGAGEVAGT